MSDEISKKKSLSEISHLFLSSVRDSATGGHRPTRIPPGAGRTAMPRADVSVDMTLEEYSRAFGRPDSEVSETAEKERPPVGPVSAVVCPQLAGKQSERVRDYARHLAAGGDRVGLLEVDSAGVTVTCFDVSADETLDNGDVVRMSDGRQVAEALEELAWDVDRWLLLLPSPRTPEARALLRNVDHWTLLSTTDHDGVVSCYRAIKGLADGKKPRLSLALLHPVDAVEAGKVFRKIAGVCQQFLGWSLEAEPAVEATDGVAEHVAFAYQPPREAIGPGPQWAIVDDLLNRAREQTAATEPAAVEEELPSLERKAMQSIDIEVPKPLSRFAQQAEPSQPAPRMPTPAPVMKLASTEPADDEQQVWDIPAGQATEPSVLAAVMKNPATGLIESPVRPPQCPAALVAVSRDHKLVLVAVARRGLTELRSIGLAYKWMVENRPLLSMALPQFSIDPESMPTLKLIVEHSDADADMLVPMTENGNVSIQTYRKLRWGDRTGLLLEAA
jgi:hypothetical protein